MENYHISIDIKKKTNALVSAYFQLREGKSARKVEFADGNLIADYDHRNRLLGVELIGPCFLAELKEVFKDEPRLIAIVQNALPPTTIVD